MSDQKTSKSFILFQEYKSHIKLLSFEQAGRLFNAIFDYNDGQEVELDPIVKMAFSFIKSDLDRNKEKYSKIIERNRVNGSKGGRPQEPKKPTGFFNNPVEPSRTLYDDEDDNEDKDDFNLENKLKLGSTLKIPKSLSLDEVAFENFWKSYIPVKASDGRFTDKGAKKPALQIFNRLLAKGHAAEVIIAGVLKYLNHCRANDSPTCHATTFLNQERFLNEYGEAQEAQSVKKKSAADQWSAVIEKMDEKIEKGEIENDLP